MFHADGYWMRLNVKICKVALCKLWRNILNYLCVFYNKDDMLQDGSKIMNVTESGYTIVKIEFENENINKITLEEKDGTYSQSPSLNGITARLSPFAPETFSLWRCTAAVTPWKQKYIFLLSWSQNIKKIEFFSVGGFTTV